MRDLREALRVYAHPDVRAMLLLGFSCGLPLFLVLNTFSFWLRESGVDRSTVGHMTWVAMLWGFKWVWAPLLDRLRLPGLSVRLGRRRAWMLLAQSGVVLGLCGMALHDPRGGLAPPAAFAALTAFFAASQDIVVDAWRIEAVGAEWQGAMAAAYQAGYRSGMIVAGAGVLWLVALLAGGESGYVYRAWSKVYGVMALLMGVGMLTVLRLREAPWQEREIADGHGVRHAWHWLVHAVVEPLADFFHRYRRRAPLLLLLVATYRIPDVVLGVMSNTFYVDMGFTRTEVAMVSKIYGVVMTLTGAGLAGLLIARLGLLRVLWLGPLFAGLGALCYAWLAGRGHDVRGLMWTISVDNLAGGLASTAFIAWMSGLTRREFSAAQYALLSSAMLLLPKFLAGFFGDLVNRWGYERFFCGLALLVLPAFLLLWLLGRAESADARNGRGTA